MCGTRTIAAHLHDTRGLRDHLIPGTGEIDYHLIANRLPADALRIFELDWYFTDEEILAGVDHLSELECCQPLPKQSRSDYVK
ncbi:MAG: hypothetical protein GY762_19900 [Proteobacteria bacterium]|nr:hypothetical protein [Pseudomonadota bacterium]